jgi:hypothetical protein
MVTTAAASPLEEEKVDEEVEFFASSSALLWSSAFRSIAFSLFSFYFILFKRLLSFCSSGLKERIFLRTRQDMLLLFFTAAFLVAIFLVIVKKSFQLRKFF